MREHIYFYGCLKPKIFYIWLASNSIVLKVKMILTQQILYWSPNGVEFCVILIHQFQQKNLFKFACTGIIPIVINRLLKFKLGDSLEKNRFQMKLSFLLQKIVTMYKVNSTKMRSQGLNVHICSSDYDLVTSNACFSIEYNRKMLMKIYYA